MHLFLDEMKPRCFHKYVIGNPQIFSAFPRTLPPKCIRRLCSV